jgi:hydroxymethylpyrimidine pyrophosphatase-like HAD family hydrolase
VRWRAFATDYDETLAHEGLVAPHIEAALVRLSRSGRRLVLVTGRRLPSILHAFPRIEIFDRVVAENGALLYAPHTGQERLLAPPPPTTLDAMCLARGVTLFRGTVLLGADSEHEATVRAAIRELGLPLDLIFNKGAMMILPSGVDKASGLAHALAELGVPPADTVGIGDAENDEVLLDLCGCGVAVANALAALRLRADIVTRNAGGDGALEIIESLIGSDLADRTGPVPPRRTT